MRLSPILITESLWILLLPAAMVQLFAQVDPVTGEVTSVPLDMQF